MKLQDRFWHGVGTDAAWATLQAGGSLQLPETHAHDPGDYGLAVYLTSSRTRAQCYARSKDRVVFAKVELRCPIVFDWRIKRSALDPEHPANKLIARLIRDYGDTVHGTLEDRKTAATRWRTGLLSEGHDSVLVLQKPADIEIAVFEPRKTIRELIFIPAEVAL